MWWSGLPLVSESIPKAPKQYPLVSAPSIPHRVQVKNLPVPEVGLEGDPSSAFVGSEPEGDVAALPELVDDPPSVEEAPEAVAPAEEEVAETCVVEVGLLRPWTPD
jgi:hypothetical protein